MRTSSSFPSAHVFPGGNLSSTQDGNIPGPEDTRRHQDGKAYKLAAIRECFEESGLLLAMYKNRSGGLLEVSDQEREKGRHAIHEGKILFRDWLDERGGLPDTGLSFKGTHRYNSRPNVCLR